MTPQEEIDHELDMCIKRVELTLLEKRAMQLRRELQQHDQDDVMLAFEADRLLNTRGFEPT